MISKNAVAKLMISAAICVTPLANLTACSASANETSKTSSTTNSNKKNVITNLKNVKYKKAVSYYRNGTTYKGKAYSLKLNTKKYTIKTIKVNGKKIKVRCYTNLVYVSKPVDKKYETMNIYIPEAYFHNKKVNGYTKKTAPIFMPNNVGGYMSATAGTLNGGGGGSMPSGSAPKGAKGKPSGKKPSGKMPSGKMPSTSKKSTKSSGFTPTGKLGKGLNANGGASSTSSIKYALSKGYVVASPGVRGRDAKKNGKYDGKAPAAIVDLKAAVRYLKYNKSRLVGNTNKIISDGTSAGGALSALLAASGNNADYAPYLKAIGAANTSDNIYGAFAFCPITNLENADKAYEWQSQGITSIAGGGPGNTTGSNTLSSKSQKLSSTLANNFVTYVNSLNLKDGNTTLKLSSDGKSGSFADLVKKAVKDSAQKALDSGTKITEKKYPFLTIKNGKVTDVDLTKYFKSIGRSKSVPAFDSLDLSQAENIEFGTSTKNAQHFTKFSTENNTKKGATTANSSIVKMMNPMNYLSNSDTAKYIWIRYGETDTNTSIAVPLILSQAMKNAGMNVNYHLQWNTGHTGDYDMTNMFKWADKISK